MEDHDQDGKQPCCDGPNCCSVPVSGGSSAGNGWRVLASVSVILLASAVAAYSFFWRGEGDGSGSCCPAGSAGCPTTDGGLPLIAGMESEIAGYDIVLVVLPSPDNQLPQAMTTTVTEANIALNARGQQSRRLTLNPADPVFASAVDQFEVDTFPAIVVLGRASSVVLSGNNVTRDKILKTCDQNLLAVPTCDTPVDLQERK